MEYTFKTIKDRMQLPYEPTQTPLSHNLTADKKTLKILKQALIKSKLEYGNTIYESTSKTNSSWLIPFRNKAL